MGHFWINLSVCSALHSILVGCLMIFPFHFGMVARSARNMSLLFGEQVAVMMPGRRCALTEARRSINVVVRNPAKWTTVDR